jgi:hypothetical protein
MYAEKTVNTHGSDEDRVTDSSMTLSVQRHAAELAVVVICGDRALAGTSARRRSASRLTPRVVVAELSTTGAVGETYARASSIRPGMARAARACPSPERRTTRLTRTWTRRVRWSAWSKRRTLNALDVGSRLCTAAWACSCWSGRTGAAGSGWIAAKLVASLPTGGAGKALGQRSASDEPGSDELSAV